MSQSIKPPIQLFGIEGRYATALFSAASRDKKLESVEKELVKFQGTLKTDTKLAEFILNPTIKRQVKVNGLKAVSSKVPLSSYSANLLELLAENGRLPKLDGVINAFKTIMSAYRGEVRPFRLRLLDFVTFCVCAKVICEVTTAKTLEDDQRKVLEGVLKSFLKSNETVNLRLTVDPTIIGGMIVSVGDRYVDMSVATKIRKYTDIISTPV